MTLVALVTGCVVAAAASAGIGLLRRRAWARPTDILAAVAALFILPVRTLVGLYALWVLTRPETKAQLNT